MAITCKQSYFVFMYWGNLKAYTNSLYIFATDTLDVSITDSYPNSVWQNLFFVHSIVKYNKTRWTTGIFKFLLANVSYHIDAIAHNEMYVHVLGLLYTWSEKIRIYYFLLIFIILTFAFSQLLLFFFCILYPLFYFSACVQFEHGTWLWYNLMLSWKRIRTTITTLCFSSHIRR